MKKQLFNFKTVVMALGIFFSTTASADFTAVTSGNWSSPATWGGIAPTATVSNQNITIPAGITVTLDADVTFSGLISTFMVNGTLSNTTGNGITMTQGALGGSGTIAVNKVRFTTLSTASFSGNMNVKHLMNSTTALAITALANISDTLELESGSLLLNTNANVTMLSNSTVKVNNGSMVIGGGIFTSSNAYNVMYVGSSKTTGIELNTTTLQHAYLNMSSNSQVVTLNNNLIINGNTNFNSGKMALNGKQLTLKGNLNMAAGTTFTSTSASNLSIEGTGALTGTLMFDNGSSINDLSINRTNSGTVKLGSSLNVAGHLNLTEGAFSVENGGSLTMNSGSTAHVEKGTLSLNSGTFNGTAAYNVEYMGSVSAVPGVELSGAGLNNLTIDYTSGSNGITMTSNLTVAGQLNMNKGKLNLNGKNLTLNGTVSQNANGQFIGNGSSELNLNLTSTTNDTLFFDNSNATAQTLSKLKLNMGGTNPVIVLGSGLILNNELSFVKGQVALTNGDLQIMSAATITGYDNTKYVVTSGNYSGSLIMNVNAGSSYVTFPVGTSTDYSPAHVQQASSATSGTFSTRAMNTVLSGGTSGFVNSNSLKVVNRTWFVESSVTSINANLKFGWMAASEVNGFDRTNAYISHFSSSQWDIVASASATAGANSTYELSRTGITSLSPFAVTQSGEPLKVNEISKTTGMDVFPNPAKDVVTVKLVNPTDTYKYELTDITGRTIATSSNDNSVNKFDVSNLGTGCYFIKITNLTDHKTTTKRFIKD